MALHTPAVATSDETRASLENFGAYTASMLPKYIQAAQVTLSSQILRTVQAILMLLSTTQS